MTTVVIFIAVIVFLIIFLIINSKRKDQEHQTDLNKEYITQGTRKNMEDPKKL